MENPLEFGIVITRDDGSIERFLEKPTWGQVFSDTINTGIYVLEPEIFDYIEPDKPVDFSSDVFPRLLDDGRPLFGYVAEGYWEDVGTLDAYIKAHQDVLDGQVELDIPGFRLGDGIWLGEGSEIDPAATVDGPAIIGDYCRVEAGARLAEYTVLGSNVRVGPDAFIERSVVHDNVYLGPRSPAAWRGGRAGRATCAAAPGSRRAWSSATSASSASTPSSTPASRSTPSRRSSTAPSSTPRSCGSREGPATSSAGSAWPAWPTSTSRRSWRCGWPWRTAPP